MRPTAITISFALLTMVMTTLPVFVTIQNNLTQGYRHLVSLTLACPKGAKCSEACTFKAFNLYPKGELYPSIATADIGQCCISDATLYVMGWWPTVSSINKLDPANFPICDTTQLSLDSTGPNQYGFTQLKKANKENV